MTPFNPAVVVPDEQAPHLREAFVSREAVFNGRLLKVSRDTVTLPDEASATREFIQHPGAVMVIPLLDDGRVLLERQYRYPMRRVMLEFPAGKLDPNEPTLACAQRELREETGYSAAEWAYAGCIHPLIAYSTEVIHIWFARQLTAGRSDWDEGEFLELGSLLPDELESAIVDGQVTDGKTVAGMFWLRRWLDGRLSLTWS